MRGMHWLPWVFLAAALSACEADSKLAINVEFETPALAKRVAKVELSLLRDCPSPLEFQRAPASPIERWDLRKGVDNKVAVKSHAPGKYALFARGMASDCKTVAGACTPVRITSDGGKLSVTLGKIAALACGDLEQCDAATVECSCASGAHACDGTCVSDASPLTCGDRCEPCEGVTHGFATCDNGECGTSCSFGFAPCSSGCCPDVGTELVAAYGTYPAKLPIATGPIVTVAAGADHVPHVLFSGGVLDSEEDPAGLWHMWRDNGVWKRDAVNDTNLFSFQSRIDVDSQNRPVVVYAEPSLIKYAVREASGTWQTESIAGALGLQAFQLDHDTPVIVFSSESVTKYGAREQDGSWSFITSPKYLGYDSQSGHEVSAQGANQVGAIQWIFQDLGPDDSYFTAKFIHIKDDQVDLEQDLSQFLGQSTAAKVACRADRCVGIASRAGLSREVFDYHDGALLEEVLTPGAFDDVAVGLSPDGQTMWVFYTVFALPDPMDAGADAGDGMTTLPIGSHLEARVKQGVSGTWRTVQVDGPKAYLVFPTVSVDPDGGAHVVAWSLSEFLTGNLQPDLQYVYIPRPDNLD